MNKSLALRRIYLQFSVKYGTFACIVLLIVLKYADKEKFHRSLLESGKHEESFQNNVKMVNFVKEMRGTERGLYKRAPNDNSIDVLKLARKVSRYNKSVLVSVVNDAYLPFVYSWLCNTKDMRVHKSVLIITTDKESKRKLNRDWPEVSVFHMEHGIPKGGQTYNFAGYLRIMIRRTEIILSLLQADIDLLLLEFDFVWFSNPVPGLQSRMGVDILINPVSTQNGTLYNGGFIYLFATDRTKALWTRLTDMMLKLEVNISKKSDYMLWGGANDQTYFSKLITERYANITTQLLPLDTFADGKWYSMTDSERKKLHPIVISNNWIIGNNMKIYRAKEWGHWFLRPDDTCDTDAVNKIVNNGAE